MRAIVALLKYFVGAAFLICTISLAFIIGGSLVGFTFGAAGSALSSLTILIGVAVFVVLVLYVGIVALLISGHDRLCEITALMSERNELLRSGAPDFE
jgi:hypothetical protein